MMLRKSDTARVIDPELHAAYEHCRRLNARHGKTYFLATRLLSPRQRPAIHALYGFTRRLDDIVDEPAPGATPATVAAELDAAGDRLLAGLAAGSSRDPLLAAVIDTATRYRIPAGLFADFLHSMRMDLTTTAYPTRAALDVYIRGSAEVIGLQVLPVLGTLPGAANEAGPPAAALGKAFQLTNFLRDIAEDFRRGRVYLPADELAAFGVGHELLRWCVHKGRVDPRVRRAIADQIATTRAVYRRARPGVDLLHPASRPCVATALTLYGEILDRIEDAEYNVFDHRAKVSRPRRLTVAASAVTRTVWARRRKSAAMAMD
jgi:phytoene synthase